MKCEQRPSVQKAYAAEIVKFQSVRNRKIATRLVFDILKTVYGQILGRVSRSVKKMSGRIALLRTRCPKFLRFLSSLRKSAHKPF